MIKKKKLSYFFFQAEDGIRVLYVTGVQTCALPIYHLAPLVERDLEERAHLERRVQPGVVDEDVDGAAAAHDLLDQLADRLLVGDIGREPERSEERRVGKECRFWWLPYDQKKKAKLFFFSSRRRHTSSLRDWSSDVCSSDLSPGATRREGSRGTSASGATRTTRRC